jgi:signal transduction histidine kinase
MPRHWFFMKILMFFFWICVALTISFFWFGGLSAHQIFHAFLMVFLVMLVGSMILRRMFRPLRWLMKGVQEISNGNLDFQFPVKGPRHGEIWYLADQFNLMVRAVKEMVESRQQLLRDVSHELRSPLTRLKVALEMTPKGKMKDSMLRDVTEMETMITEILETERLKNGNGKLALASVDLAALIRETLSKYKSRKPGIKLVGKPKSIIIQADEARVKTVLQNVLENALKYSASRKKSVEVGLSQDEKEALITVQDFGQGIPSEDQEKVFEPFYRVDKSRTKDTGGYGLGLSLCREIMRAHGGDIRLESEPGLGTKVTLYFPC